MIYLAVLAVLWVVLWFLDGTAPDRENYLDALAFRARWERRARDERWSGR